MTRFLLLTFSLMSLGALASNPLEAVCQGVFNNGFESSAVEIKIHGTDHDAVKLFNVINKTFTREETYAGEAFVELGEGVSALVATIDNGDEFIEVRLDLDSEQVEENRGDTSIYGLLSYKYSDGEEVLIDMKCIAMK